MRTINEAGNLSGKKVLVRNDFNITIDKEGKILDDFKLRASLPTIKYLLENEAKIILMSHFGRPEGKVVESMRLTPIQGILSDYLSAPIKKVNDCIGLEVEKAASELKNGEILLLENLRFYAEEEKNDEEFAKNLAKLGDVFINDAFGACHRAHASIVNITKFLPSYAGFLLAREVEVLTKARDNPERPLTVIIGGVKISTKIKLIKEYLGKADNVILGGALANAVLHAQGIAVGKSFVEEGLLPQIQDLAVANPKLHIPLDVILSVDKSGAAPIRTGPVGKTEENEIILDIGPETEQVFDSIIRDSKMVIWNGPMGFFEVEQFTHGTKAIAQSIANCSDCFSIAGGGETTCFIEKMGLIEKFSHVSTGGGAMMEFLAGDKLPGVEVLKD